MRFDWKLKDILMIGIVGVLFVFPYQAMNYAGAAICAALTPFGLATIGWEPIYGVWFMAGYFALYVIRKPGTGLVAEMLAALLEALWGSMFGPSVFITGFVQGLGTEIGFALGRYKYDKKSVALSGVTTAVICFAWSAIGYGYFALEPWLVILMLAIRILSGVIFAFVTKLLADGLAKAGVLNGYTIGQNVVDIDED